MYPVWKKTLINDNIALKLGETVPVQVSIPINRNGCPICGDRQMYLL